MMPTLNSCDDLARLARSKSVGALAVDEPFWAHVAALYDRDPSFVQLNYGYYHPSLRPVFDVELATARELNRRGSHFKRFDSWALLEAARTELAELAGADAEEIVITRNTSEAMNIVIQGLALTTGDEIVASDQDYGGMDQAWAQREKNDGVRLRRVALPLDPTSDDEIVACFDAAITPRTRLLHVTDVIHFTGQILPVAKLCALARRRGLQVVVDAAHAFAQIDFKIRDLDCDYLAASLHKWLGAPLGTGVLYVRRDRIAGLRPLYGDTQRASENIRRLEHFGNRPDSANAGLREAIRWHHALGSALKQARLAHLHRRWTEPLRTWPRFRVLSPRSPDRCSAIGLFTLEGVPAEKLCDYLLHEHQLLVAVQNLPTVTGLRITPGLPTSLADITRLLEALRTAAARFS